MIIPPLKKPSFAEVVSKSTSSVLSVSFAQPIKEGVYVSIQINEKIYSERVSMCQRALIGRTILSKGEKLWKI